MKECYFCGISEEKAILYEVVGKEGVIPVCRRCYFKENEMPVIEKRDPNKIPQLTVRERLAKMNNLPAEKEVPKAPRRNLQDVSLNDLIEKNYRQNLSEVKVEPTDLVSNFHWVVMRKRRQFKISQKELAERICEPSVAIEFLEKGILPQEYENLIKKVEEALKIQLFKEPKNFIDSERLPQESKVPSELTVGDLKKEGFFSRLFKKKKKRDESPVQEDAEKKEDEQVKAENVNENKSIEQPKEEKSSLIKHELSQKEINDLIFSKKKR